MASALALRPDGFMNSSRRISPGVTGASLMVDDITILSVIVNDFDAGRAVAGPSEADAVLVVDPYAMQPFSVTA